MIHDRLSNRCNNVASKILFDNFELMEKKIKITSMVSTVYLCILLLFFYLHAMLPRHKFYLEDNDRISISSIVIREDGCNFNLLMLPIDLRLILYYT